MCEVILESLRWSITPVETTTSSDKKKRKKTMEDIPVRIVETDADRMTCFDILGYNG